MAKNKTEAMTIKRLLTELKGTKPKAGIFVAVSINDTIYNVDIKHIDGNGDEIQLTTENIIL